MVKVLSGYDKNLGATKKSTMTIKIGTKKFLWCMMKEFGPTGEEFEDRRSMSCCLGNLTTTFESDAMCHWRDLSPPKKREERIW
jgi:hypothetical protein